MPTQWSEAEQAPLGCIAPPRPQARNPPASLCEAAFQSLPLRGRWREAPEGEICHGSAVASRKRSVPRPGAGYFCPRRQKYPKTPFKPAVWKSLTRLRPPLISLVLPRERCAMRISPKCCIVSAPLPAAAFALKCKAVRLYIWCVGADDSVCPSTAAAAQTQKRSFCPHDKI